MASVAEASRLVLISPAIGVEAAIIGRMRPAIVGAGLASGPQIIEAEFDPFKYMSFSWRAVGRRNG
jgi:hypothetical protein